MGRNYRRSFNFRGMLYVDDIQVVKPAFTGCFVPFELWVSGVNKGNKLTFHVYHCEINSVCRRHPTYLPICAVEIISSCSPVTPLTVVTCSSSSTIS